MQTYISSLAAACCDEKVQIIGFNPDTDFVITPWVASQFDGTLRRGQIIAGASINVSDNNTVKLYGHEFPVAAQLADTGTSLDNSIFVNMDTVPDVVSYSAQVGHAAIPEEYAGKAVVVFPFSGLIAKELQLPYLQIGVGKVAVLIVVALLFAVLTGLVASLATAVRLSAPQAYLTLREGE